MLFGHQANNTNDTPKPQDDVAPEPTTVAPTMDAVLPGQDGGMPSMPSTPPAPEPPTNDDNQQGSDDVRTPPEPDDTLEHFEDTPSTPPAPPELPEYTEDEQMNRVRQHMVLHLHLTIPLTTNQRTRPVMPQPQAIMLAMILFRSSRMRLTS